MSSAAPSQTPPPVPDAPKSDHDVASHRRDTLLLIWLFASVGCFVVYAVYSSYRVTTSAEQPARIHLVGQPPTVAEPAPAIGESEAIRDAEQFMAKVHATEERLRELRQAKLAKQKRPQVEWTGETRRLKKIDELKTYLATVTEFPEGSVQWHLRNELERLERNELR